MPLFPWGLIMLPWAKFYHIKRGLSSHTDAKSQYWFKNSILMKSTPTLNLNFPAQKRNYCELDFLNKNWDFTTVCQMISNGLCSLFMSSRESWSQTLGDASLMKTSKSVNHESTLRSNSTVFENHRKSLIQRCERSELRLHFEWTKVN